MLIALARLLCRWSIQILLRIVQLGSSGSRTLGLPQAPTRSINKGFSKQWAGSVAIRWSNHYGKPSIKFGRLSEINQTQIDGSKPTDKSQRSA